MKKLLTTSLVGLVVAFSTFEINAAKLPSTQQIVQHIQAGKPIPIPPALKAAGSLCNPSYYIKTPTSLELHHLDGMLFFLRMFCISDINLQLKIPLAIPLPQHHQIGKIVAQYQDTAGNSFVVNNFSTTDSGFMFVDLNVNPMSDSLSEDIHRFVTNVISSQVSENGQTIAYYIDGKSTSSTTIDKDYIFENFLPRILFSGQTQKN